MRQVQRTLRFGVVLAAALAGGWLYAQGQPVTQCGTTIDVPGHYELASDIGPCPGNGVTITANDVTFDLAGHTHHRHLECGELQYGCPADRHQRIRRRQCADRRRHRAGLRRRD